MAKELNPKVYAYIEKEEKWHEEFKLLREAILKCDLDEDVKWNHPCYTLDGKNIVLIHGFNDYCALLFHKGALIDDKKQLLIQQTKHVQSARQMRFKSVEDVKAVFDEIPKYVEAAIEVEKKGLKVEKKGMSEEDFPEVLLEAFKEDEDFEAAFKGLTPGRQRAYALFIGGAKREATQKSRLEKYYDHILDGKGINDK
ncbi:YdeI/OmpD-associated family protein [Staphylococcus massiliensis]|uniref:YdhG-like domain-containing protein n=1 Tax=Staphylococcus massiliensis S46 TaxID=1229783 RepID=K9AWW3_9STAP|nr:DUF1801 domain-containing protein [Staphylococcus massiliensis]EKU45995.1 hypothetical protein C273_10362 [Staphylococcus massiliensis S46]MCG3399253.1 DUF1801 domain-containing protein [Staphylococcus massiliensis]PNZ97906.1 hypothetical protein CD133_09850 [Staphylococcus massiliensis CCUG 55927]